MLLKRSFMNNKSFARKFANSAVTGVFLAVVTLGAAPGVWAQAAAPGTAARMQSEKATCDGVQQDKAACLREAGAAREEAGRAGLTTVGPAGNSANAMDRCRLQPPADQADCMARIEGSSSGNTSTSTSGSVMGGGLIRETVTTTPAK
jgi:hypothetical protein